MVPQRPKTLDDEVEIAALVEEDHNEFNKRNARNNKQRSFE